MQSHIDQALWYEKQVGIVGAAKIMSSCQVTFVKTLNASLIRGLHN